MEILTSAKFPGLMDYLPSVHIRILPPHAINGKSVLWAKRFSTPAVLYYNTEAFLSP